LPQDGSQIFDQLFESPFALTDADASVDYSSTTFDELFDDIVHFDDEILAFFINDAANVESPTRYMLKNVFSSSLTVG
jgi:hypothetical protein